MTKTVFITGATSGFGEASARIFAENHHRLILSGRRANRLKLLAEELEKQFQVEIKTLCFDVRNNSEVEQSINSLELDWKKIDVLVNNAGLASGFDHIDSGNVDDWDKMIDTNLKGLLYVSKCVIPLMIAREEGHIINIGSTAGKEVYERGNVYCATKHAVDAITKGMRIDLLGRGIKVTQISPGAAETEFSEVRFHGDKARAKAAYNGYEPMSAADVASLIDYSTTLPPNLCINDLVVTSISQANSFYTNRT